MLESSMEKIFTQKLQKLGCFVIKCKVEGYAGMPDRQVLIPGGISVFIEMKKDGEEPRPLQMYRLKQLNKLGFQAIYINSMGQVQDFVKSVEGQIIHEVSKEDKHK